MSRLTKWNTSLPQPIQHNVAEQAVAELAVAVKELQKAKQSRIEDYLRKRLKAWQRYAKRLEAIGDSMAFWGTPTKLKPLQDQWRKVRRAKP